MKYQGIGVQGQDQTFWPHGQGHNLTSLVGAVSKYVSKVSIYRPMAHFQNKNSNVVILKQK